MNHSAIEKVRRSGMHTGTWLSVGSPAIAELASLYPFQWLLFDLEHGCGTDASLLANLQAAKREGLALIVRVGRLDPALISRILDWGASGIMLPHTASPQEAGECVAAMRYPPEGSRGFSSSARAFGYGLGKLTGDPPPPLFFAQIETSRAVRNAGEIAAVKGVDVLFVGPADLKLDILTNSTKFIPDFETALRTVSRTAAEHGKQAGILARNPEDLEKYLKMGFSCIAYGSDLGFLKEGFQNTVRLFNDPANPQ